MIAADLIREAEGLRLKPYRCSAGKLSIGYGRNLDDQGITLSEAEEMLYADILRAAEHLKLEPYWHNLAEARQAVLIDLVYNIGWTRFAQFQKMRAALRAGDYQRAADEMQDSLWYTQVGRRGPRNVRLMRGGELPPVADD